MFLLIDNYDSFTYNLYHYMRELGIDVRVERNDALSVNDCLSLAPEAIVISPGPCTPDDAGLSLELIAKAPETLPIFGVCLGHQCIGQYFGGTVTRAPYVMHGKTSEMFHQGSYVFKGLPSPFIATRYHSLIVEKVGLPDCLEITAETEDGLIMGLRHKSRPLYGVQFHPESIASEGGYEMLANFVELATGERPKHIPSLKNFQEAS